MKYFKFKNPYNAVISAEVKENAKKIYSKYVCKINTNMKVEEITKDEVVKLWEDANIPLHELVDLMQEEGLILIDGALI